MSVCVRYGFPIDFCCLFQDPFEFQMQEDHEVYRTTGPNSMVRLGLLSEAASARLLWNKLPIENYPIGTHNTLDW